MAATEQSHNHWREQFARPENSTSLLADAEARMFAGTPMAATTDESSPLSDALWLNDADLAERQHIQRQVNSYEDSAAVSFCGIHTYHVYNLKGEWLGPAQKFVDKQRRRAYAMFEQGFDVKQIAVAVYRDVPWVEAIKQEFEF